MPATVLKFVVAGIVGTVLLAGAGLVLFVLYLRSLVNAPDANRPFVESEAFAKEHTQSECVDEAFARSRSCWLFRCRVENQLFVERCVRLARPSPELCRDAPPPTMHNGPRTAEWTQRECTQRGHRLSTFTCIQILQTVAQSCWNREHEHP